MNITDIQKNAFEHLASGAPSFANPIQGITSSMTSLTSNLGGFDMAGMSSAMNKLKESDMGLYAELSGMLSGAKLNVSGFGGLKSAADATTAHIQGILTPQIPGMKFENLLSSASSYGSMLGSFGQTREASLCGGLDSLMGSMKGTLNGAIGSATSAMSDMSSKLTSALGSAGGPAKQGFSDAIVSINAAIATGGAIPPALASQIKGSLGTATSAVQSAMSDASNGLNSALTAGNAAVASAMSSINSTIATEKENLGKMFSNLGHMATTMSFPSLNPCAKQIVANTAGAAGAGSIVALVA